MYHDNFRRVQSNDELNIEKVDVPDFEKVTFFRNVKRRKKSYHGRPNHRRSNQRNRRYN